jgi:hypothetical protein
MIGSQMVVRLSSLHTGHALLPEMYLSASGTQFCESLSEPQGQKD